MNQIICYEAPKGAIGKDDYRVRVRAEGGQWQDLFVYEVKVDMHNVRHASMSSFDMSGTVEVEVTSLKTTVEKAVIRPLSATIKADIMGSTIAFTLEQPRKLVVEINGERFSCLHLFANPVEKKAPQPDDANVLLLKPSIHRTEDIYSLAQTPLSASGKSPEVLYFAPGMHYIEEVILRIPSHTNVYIAGGAIIVGSLVCEGVEHVSIAGRGILYLSDFHRFSAFRGVRIVYSQHISVEGITLLDPPHYSIYIGKSQHVKIRNFKSFSTRGWSDGIDMMASENIEIEDVFLRTSDDSIAVYATRWDYKGDTRNVTVRNSVFWADVAHALMIGTHGNHEEGGGDTIEQISFENIDILEHHEPQENYWGAMAINAGDNNKIRNITYKNCHVEDFELGQLLDIRVLKNKDYNPVPGNLIEQVVFENIVYNGANAKPNRINGYNAERVVKDVTFINLRINGQLVATPEQGNFTINEFTKDVTFSASE